MPISTCKTRARRRWHQYFTNPWCIFEFVVLMVISLPLCLSMMSLLLGSSTLRPSQSLRYKCASAVGLRLFSLLLCGTEIGHGRDWYTTRPTSWEKAKHTVTAGFFAGLRSAPPICALLLAIVYLYAILGVRMFRENDPVHFGSLHEAVLMLTVHLLTLDGWGHLMYTNTLGCERK